MILMSLHKKNLREKKLIYKNEHNKIKSLLGVDHIDVFLDNHFDKKPYSFVRNNESIFHYLNFDMEEILTSNASSWGEIRLARYPDPDASLVKTPPSGVVLDRAYKSGHTIVVNDLQNKIKNIYCLCRDIENLFICKSNCNAYISPEKSQGLDIHYDNQDIIILQLAGEKFWEYDHVSCLYPLDDDIYDEQYISACTDLNTIQLTPGSVLYLPRGTAHRVKTGTDTHSIHLTISITPFRYLHLIQNLLEIAAKDDVMLRKAIPPKEVKALLAGDDTSALLQMTNHIVNTITDKNSDTTMSYALLTIVSSLLNNQSANLGFSFEKLSHLQKVNCDSLLKINQDQHIIFSRVDNKIYYIGGEITLDSDHMFLVELLCKRDAFFVNDIKYEQDHKKIEIAQSLIDIGLVTQCKDKDILTKQEKTTQFECTICGYIYDENKEAVLFKNVDKIWVCPHCLAEASFFKNV